MLRKAGILLAAAVIGVIPAAARADHRDRDRDDSRRGGEWRREVDRRDDRRRDSDRRDRGYFDIRIGGGSTYCPPPAPICPPPICEERVWVAPVYRTVCDRRWVEPVYRTVCDRVWIEPVTQTTCERAWVPDRYEWRNIDQWANGRHYTAREYVLVEPAHWADVPRTVVITPGRYEDRPRQELVCAGHWETRPVIVAAPAPRRYEESHARIDLRIPF
jgi:hypothetical protein